MKIFFKLIALLLFVAPASAYDFSKKDRKFLESLSIKKAGEPLTAGNEYANNLKAAELGKKIFFDKRFSKNGQISCATCHNPALHFTDGRPVSIGLAPTRRNSPSVLFSAYSPWQFWDGRKDSMWAQALSPLEAKEEHGLKRSHVRRLILWHYAGEYKAVFGKISASSDRIFANVGKALMAYQLQLKSGPSRFDKFIDAVVDRDDDKVRELFSPEEVAGLLLFVGKANCISCHNGPLLTNFEFHNVGIPEADQSKVDLGRWDGVKKLAKSEFSCLSNFSSTPKEKCLEMKFLKSTGPELVGAFKTPSLRNVAKTAPYMHSGQFATLEDVIEHYNKPKPPFYDREQHPNRPHFDIFPLRLSDEEKKQLVAFLKTLTSSEPEGRSWWTAPKKP